MAPRFPIRTELQMSDTWFNISPWVYNRDPVDITRGRPDEGSNTDPGECSLTLDNRDGRFSMRNPEGPYYRWLGRNTPIRVWVGQPPDRTWAWAFGLDRRTQTPPRIDFSGADGIAFYTWISEYGDVPSPGSYALPAELTEGPETDGHFSTMAIGYETVTEGLLPERTATYSTEVASHAIAGIAVAGESGPPVIEEEWADWAGRDPVRFVTGADTVEGDWLLAIHAYGFDHPDDDPMPNEPGGTPGLWNLVADTLGTGGQQPRIKAWMRRVDVAGPQQVVFDDANSLFSLFDHHARLYRLSNAAFMSLRFAGEVAAWPSRWDASDTDVHVPIKAAGILRRLGQGAKALRSAAYRQILNDHAPTPMAYWPCEDGEASSQIASGLPGGEPMSITGIPELSSYEGFAASEPLPLMKSGSFFGDVPAYTPGSQQQIQWLMHVPRDGTVDQQTIVRMIASGTAVRWEVRYHTGGGGLSFHVWNDQGVKVHDGQIWGFDVDGELLRCAFELTQNGPNIDFDYGQLALRAESGSTIGFTVPGETLGRITRVAMAPGSEVGGIGDVAMGHVAVHNTITSIFDLGPAFNAWRFEPAGRRIERLCNEEGVGFVAHGDLQATAPTGHQDVSTLLDLLQEAATADGGILHEIRTQLGLTYRTRRSIYNQDQVT